MYAVKTETCQIISPKMSGRAIVRAIAETHGFSLDALIGFTQTDALCRARAEAMTALADKGWSLAQISSLFGNRARSTILRAINTHQNRARNTEDYRKNPWLVEEVEAQIRRLAGVNLAPQVAHELTIPTWQAIFLAILMEAYPNVKTADQIMEAYVAAVERIYRGDEPEVMDSQIRTFCYHIRQRFIALGLPDPVEAIRPRNYVLSYDAAVWLHNRFGKPVTVAIRQKL